MLRREHNVVEVKLPLIFQLALVELVLQTLLFVALALLYSTLGLEYLGAGLSKSFDASFPFLPLFVAAVLLAPVTEELIFRLPLVFSGSYLLVACITFLVSFGPSLAHAFGVPLLYYFIAAALLLAMGAWLLVSRQLRVRLHLFWRKHFGFVFYTSTAVFSLLHLLNYQGSTLPFVMLLPLLLPKFLAGIFLGYARLRLGLGWAVALHMFSNFVILLLLLGYWARI